MSGLKGLAGYLSNGWNTFEIQFRTGLEVEQMSRIAAPTQCNHNEISPMCEKRMLYISLPHSIEA